jgi:hypothetical protein
MSLNICQYLKRFQSSSWINCKMAKIAQRAKNVLLYLKPLLVMLLGVQIRSLDVNKSERDPC